MMEKIKEGDILTIKDEIFSGSGKLIFSAGQKVTVHTPIVNPAFFGKMSGKYYPEELIGTTLKEASGEWLLRVFAEFDTPPPPRKRKLTVKK